MKGASLHLTQAEITEVYSALDKIEEAQSLIDAAAEILSPIDGFVGEWSASGPVYTAVRNYWLRVSTRLSELGGRGGSLA